MIENEERWRKCPGKKFCEKYYTGKSCVGCKHRAVPVPPSQRYLLGRIEAAIELNNALEKGFQVGLDEVGYEAFDDLIFMESVRQKLQAEKTKK